MKSDRLTQFSALWSYLLWALKGQKRNRKGEERSRHLIILCFRVPQRRGPPQPASLWEVPWGLGSGMIAFLFLLFFVLYIVRCVCKLHTVQGRSSVSLDLLQQFSCMDFPNTLFACYIFSFFFFLFFFPWKLNTACVYKGRVMCSNNSMTGIFKTPAGFTACCCTCRLRKCSQRALKV